jgi:hypothetical protein
MLDAQRMKGACVQKSCPNELSNLMARSAFHKLLTAAIPQYGIAAWSHVAIAEPTKHGNTATRQDRIPTEHEHVNTVTFASDIATMTHHRISEMPD